MSLTLVLPTATRILPILTPLAAVGLAVIMGLAIPFHIMRGEANVIALHIVVVGLWAFVALGPLSAPSDSCALTAGSPFDDHKHGSEGEPRARGPTAS